MKVVEPLTSLKDFDSYELNRQLDITRSKIFLGGNSAFFGSLLCSMDFFWTTGIQTAATDGNFYCWNPHWFLELPKDSRPTVLLHELWHPARIHGARIGSRDHRLWNIACDIKINNDLTLQGHSFIGLENCYRDLNLKDKVEEDIYEIITDPSYNLIGSGSWIAGEDDLLENSDPLGPVNNVIRAVHEAQKNGEPGSVPGDTEELINSFMAPIVPWEQYLHQFMQELLRIRYKWNRPNRRYSHIYLPNRTKDTGRLAHIVFFLDVSGSITQNQLRRFTSEVHHVKERYKPRKLTIIQFDTRISSVEVLEELDDLNDFHIKGGGGTSLVPVKQWIDDNEPTAAVIFSDMQVAPMASLNKNIPVLWIVADNPSATVPYGKKVHVKTEHIS